jgi:RNase P/RNase MRP subunit POP5
MKRVRRRYLLFILHRDGPPVPEKRLAAEIRKQILSLYGELVVADSKLYLNEYDEQSGIGILQCTENSLKRVIAAAALINVLDSTSVSFEPVRTSGTVKGLKKELQFP